MSVTTAYLNDFGDKIYDDIDRVEVNGVTGDIIAVRKNSARQVEVIFRPSEEIKSLNLISIYTKDNLLVYQKRTNINIQDMYNIELKVRIGVVVREI